ncbi:MAG: hypothetical protein ABEJ58_11110 [Halodesulfurarchaeum sp.]
MADDFDIVDPRTVETEQFEICDVSHRTLTEELRCAEMRVNQVLVEPGEVVTPHAHEDHEEVYVAVTGGQVEVEDDVYDVPEGGVVRLGPEPVRGVRNDTADETHVWYMFGAPPVGTVDDYGSTVFPDGTAEDRRS